MFSLSQSKRPVLSCPQGPCKLISVRLLKFWKIMKLACFIKFMTGKKRLTILGKQFLSDVQIGLKTYNGRFSRFEILEKKRTVWGLDTITLIFFSKSKDNFIQKGQNLQEFFKSCSFPEIIKCKLYNSSLGQAMNPDGRNNSWGRAGNNSSV